MIGIRTRQESDAYERGWKDGWESCVSFRKMRIREIVYPILQVIWSFIIAFWFAMLLNAAK
jgi:hypothetical protein